jgi:hypothetical protein
MSPRPKSNLMKELLTLLANLALVASACAVKISEADAAAEAEPLKVGCHSVG